MHSKLTKISSQLRSVSLEKKMDAARELENLCSRTTVLYCAHWYFAQNLSMHKSTFNLAIFKSSTQFWLSYFIVYLFCTIWLWGRKISWLYDQAQKWLMCYFHISFFLNEQMLWFWLVWGFFLGGKVKKYIRLQVIDLSDVSS